MTSFSDTDKLVIENSKKIEGLEKLLKEYQKSTDKAISEELSVVGNIRSDLKKAREEEIAPLKLKINTIHSTLNLMTKICKIIAGLAACYEIAKLLGLLN